MQNQIQKIEVQNGMQAAGKIPKEPVQIAVLQDGLRDIQQRLVRDGFERSLGSSAGASFRLHEMVGEKPRPFERKQDRSLRRT